MMIRSRFYGDWLTEAESEAERRQRAADPFIIGLTQHALETADIERLADLIERFLTTDDQAMRDAFLIGLARSQSELTPDEHWAAIAARSGSARRPPAWLSDWARDRRITSAIECRATER